MGPSNFEKLSDDVLTEILLHNIRFNLLKKPDDSIGPLLSISHTNQALRRLALSTPCLWSTLSLTIHRNGSFRRDEDLESKTRNDGFVNLFRLWIERSGDSLLMIYSSYSSEKRTAGDQFQSSLL